MPQVEWRRCLLCDWICETMPGKCRRCSHPVTQVITDAFVVQLIDSGDMVWCDANNTYITGGIKPSRSLL